MRSVPTLGKKNAMPQPRRRAAEMFLSDRILSFKWPDPESLLPRSQSDRWLCSITGYPNTRREKEHSSAFVQVKPSAGRCGFPGAGLSERRACTLFLCGAGGLSLRTGALLEI